MPLEKAAPGTEGFKKNIETEIAAGKPQKQAVAIAYRMSGERKDEGEPFALGPAPITRMTHPIERAMKAAQGLYMRSDAMETGRWDAVDCGEGE